VFVTGKGGTGKTTVARALAAIATDASVRATEDIDPESALAEWLGRHLGRPAAALLRRSQAFSYLIAAAPGTAELVTIGKLADEARGGAHVIVDGPSTGHARAMLEAPHTYAELAPAGPVAREARSLHERLQDPAFAAYVGVALPEPMAIAELLELQAGLPATLGRGLDLIVVNAVHPDRFSDADAERLAAIAARGPGRAPLEAVLVEHRRARREREQIRELTGQATAPVVCLPFVYPPASDTSREQRLARELAAAGY
jgi:anion-transporting  ArsA/GET3 family ATPase